MELILTEIATVDDIETFMNDFSSVDCFIYYGDPLGVCEEGSKTNAIKITYENEEYELINWSGQTTYTTKDGISFYEGTLICASKLRWRTIENHMGEKEF